MSQAPRFDAIDHLHVYVNHRAAAEAWYGRVLGLQRLEAFAHWATGMGPLTLRDAGDQLHLALFERPTEGSKQARHATIALRVGAADFVEWQRHLAEQLPQAPRTVNHGGDAASLYFSDPDGNPFEITCYDMAALRAQGALA